MKKSKKLVVVFLAICVFFISGCDKTYLINLDDGSSITVTYDLCYFDDGWLQCYNNYIFAGQGADKTYKIKSYEEIK